MYRSKEITLIKNCKFASILVRLKFRFKARYIIILKHTQFSQSKTYTVLFFFIFLVKKKYPVHLCLHASISHGFRCTVVCSLSKLLQSSIFPLLSLISPLTSSFVLVFVFLCCLSSNPLTSSNPMPALFSVLHGRDSSFINLAHSLPFSSPPISST